MQVERGSYINATGSLFDVPYLLVFSVRLQIYLMSCHKSRVYYIARISGWIVYWLIQSTQLAFIHFREK